MTILKGVAERYTPLPSRRMRTDPIPINSSSFQLLLLEFLPTIPREFLAFEDPPGRRGDSFRCSDRAFVRFLRCGRFRESGGVISFSRTDTFRKQSAIEQRGARRSTNGIRYIGWSDGSSYETSPKSVEPNVGIA